MDSMSFTVGVNMNAYSVGNIFFNAPEQSEINKAYTDVAALCHVALTEKYGGSHAAQERLEHELLLVKETNSAFFYRVLAEIAALSMAENAPMYCSPAGSFIDYLIGASPLNPLKPHYYCPQCRHFEDAPDGKDGYDLPEKSCPVCKAAMERDGHDCAERMSWASFDRTAERYSMGVRVAEPVFRKLQAYLDEQFSRRASHKGLYQHIEVMHLPSFDAIMELSERAGVPYSAVPPFDRTVWRQVAADLYERERNLQNIRALINAHGRPADGGELSFYDLLRLYGAFCATFDTHLRSDELHSGRFLLIDEINAALREHGIPEPRAAQLSYRIAWGRGEFPPQELDEKHIPGDNLWRKADCFNHVLTEYRLKWLSGASAKRAAPLPSR